jgi:hypothetical protein
MHDDDGGGVGTGLVIAPGQLKLSRHVETREKPERKKPYENLLLLLLLLCCCIC